MTETLVDVKDKFVPRDYQLPIIDSIIQHCKKPKAPPAFVDISVGGGKCLAKDTPVLMFNGSIKNAQDVIVGDQLMSHDSQPRLVTSTTTGKEMMYRVDQKRGDSYTVNESHILSFKLTNFGSNKTINIKGRKHSSGEIVNLSVTEYLSLQKWKQRELKGWKPLKGVDFPFHNIDLKIPPYILGVWLGDGTSAKPEICNVDKEVIEQWFDYAKSINLHVHTIKQKDRVNNYYITHGIKRKANPFTEVLRDYDLINNKHIPQHYLVASRKERLELLAGILDTDGYLVRGKKYDLVLKQKALAKNVEFLVRSLGMWCTANKCLKTCANTGSVGTYYRMSIGGDTRQIPCRVARRKANEFNSHGIGKTGIKVTEVGVGDYYGFELSGGDKLFLLGDFTVTHNTSIYAFVAEHVAKKGGKVMVLARQGELVEQNSEFAWKAQVRNSIYCASLGNQKSKHYPVIYGSEGTIANQIGDGGDFGFTTRSDGSLDFTWAPDLLMIDECHQIDYEKPENQYMKIINFFRTANPKIRIIGGTGSPIRGKQYIVGEFWKERLYELSTNKLVEWGWLVPPIFGFPDDEKDGYDFSSISVDKDGNSFNDDELDRIVGDPTKTHKIVKEIIEKTKDRLGVLMFCSTKKHCQEASQALPGGSYGIVSDSTGYKERNRIYKASRSGEIKYLINVGVLATGYNNPRIDTVCYLRPLDSLTLLIQTLGRGFRIPESTDDFAKVNCLVLDYGDVFARLGGLYENPILEEAVKEGAKRKGKTIICPACMEVNSMMARRCIGTIQKEDVDFASGEVTFTESRCEYFWSFRECKDQVDDDGRVTVIGCGVKNDPCARECRGCKAQLIDPNKKLNERHYTEKDLIDVLNTRFMPCKNGGILIIYNLANGDEAKEFFTPLGRDSLTKRFWRDNFIAQHIEPKNKIAFTRFLMDKNLDKIERAKKMCESGLIKAPVKITHRINDRKKSIINRKIFEE